MSGRMIFQLQGEKKQKTKSCCKNEKFIKYFSSRKEKCWCNSRNTARQMFFLNCWKMQGSEVRADRGNGCCVKAFPSRTLNRKRNKSPFTCNEYSPKLFPWFHNINHVIATLSFGEVRLLLQNRTSCLSGLLFVCNLRMLNPEHHWIVSKKQRTTVFFCKTCFNSSCKSCAALVSRFVRKKTELVIEIHERS